MDEVDSKILEILQKNAKTKIKEIARELDLPITTIHNRVKKMERERIIKKYVAVPDYSKLGKGITAFILVNVKAPVSGEKEFYEQVTKMIKDKGIVSELYVVTGDIDIILKIRVGSIGELNNFLINKLRKIDIVDKTKTLIVLSSRESF